ncbi:serine/arginine repetitive matrix protein 1-like [Homo sapiens]|uniref:serine/arginine repetitive matrix protein 1-like n=1 Tax=Homo sapiens TaxID=9606 RepID=UPI0005D03E8C|nr:serine/arginine repetitive matrix protein 1-like [Homo sapiens]|eukprot:XP_011517586.1 serine/arginine repetitive matrix protein 1-like [Homo sapiens]
MRPSFNLYGGKKTPAIKQSARWWWPSRRTSRRAATRDEHRVRSERPGPAFRSIGVPRDPLLRADPTSSGRGALPLVARRLPAPTPDPSDAPIGLAGAPTAHPPLPTRGGPDPKPEPTSPNGPPSTDRLGTAQAPVGERWTPQLRSATPRSRRPRLLLSRVLLATGEARLPPRPLLDAASWPRPHPGHASKPAAQESCVPRKSAKGRPLGLPANPSCVPPTRWDRSVRPERKHLSTGPLKNSAYVPWETSFGLLVLQRKTSMPSPLYQKSSNKQKITARPN